MDDLLIDELSWDMYASTGASTPSNTSTDAADEGAWTTVSSRRGGRKNGYGHRGLNKEPEEDFLFPLQPRRDLSGGATQMRF